MADFIGKEQGKLEIHCPFGCQREECEERDGRCYCAHLIGFTDDGKVVECITRNDRGHPVVSSRKRQQVKKGDRLVNPEYVQRDSSGSHITKTWVSSRVYRPCKPEEKAEWIKTYVHPEEADMLEPALAE